MRLLLAALPFLSACVFDAAVPAAAKLACARDDDCTGDAVCAVEIHQCVARNRDVAPPEIVDPIVDNADIAVGGSAHVSFAASEPLFALPSVFLVDQQGGQRAFTVVA